MEILLGMLPVALIVIGIVVLLRFIFRGRG